MTGIAMATFMSGGGGNVFNGIPSSIAGSQSTVGEPATCTLTFSSDGTWSMTGNVASASGVWLIAGDPSQYDVYLGYSMTTGTTFTWLNLGTTRVWTKTLSTGGYTSSSASNALSIRMANSPFTILDQANISVTLQRTN